MPIRTRFLTRARVALLMSFRRSRVTMIHTRADVMRVPFIDAGEQAR